MAEENSIFDSQEKSVLEAPSLGSFLSDVYTRRQRSKGKLKFGDPVSPAGEAYVPYGVTQHPDFARLLYPDQQPVDIHNLPGRYFGALPIIKGGDTMQFPVGVMALGMAQKPGYSPTEKQMESLIKDMQQPEADARVNEIVSRMFQQGPQASHDKIIKERGQEGYGLMYGTILPRNKSEETDVKEYREGLQATKNVANMTKLFGSYYDQIVEDVKNEKYVDPEVLQDMDTFTNVLPYIDNIQPAELHKWMNSHIGNLKSKMNVYKAIDNAVEGSPLSTTIDRFKLNGEDISGAFVETQSVSGKNIPTQQVKDIATQLVETYRYTFGKDKAGAIKEMEDRIISRFIPSTKKNLSWEPTGGGGMTSNYSVAPIEKEVNVNLPAKKQAGKAAEYFTGEVNTKSWELKANIPIQKEYKEFFDPETWQQSAPVGSKEFVISSVVEIPVHKTGPYKGKPGTQELVDKNPQLYEMKKFASGTVKSETPVVDQETGEPILDSDGNPKTESKNVPRYIDYEVIKPILDSRKITLLDNPEAPGTTQTAPKEKLTW